MTYIKFELVKDIGKTFVWNINSTHNNIGVGSIAWYSPWRKYCFFPYDETIFDVSCLTEITNFINSEMDKRK